MALSAEVERDVALGTYTAECDALPCIIHVIDGFPRVHLNGWGAMLTRDGAEARIALLKHGACEALAALEALAARDDGYGSDNDVGGSSSSSSGEDALQRSYRKLLDRPRGTGVLPSHANLLCAMLQLVPHCCGATSRHGSPARNGADGGGRGDGWGQSMRDEAEADTSRAAVATEEGRWHASFVAFLAGTSVLERLLCELYRVTSSCAAQYENCGSGSGSGSGSSSGSGSANGNGSGKGSGSGVPSLLLRDVISASTVRSALPDGAADWLATMLLPTGLNLRNLAWHGFLSAAGHPHEDVASDTTHDPGLAPEYGALLLVIVAEVADALSLAQCNPHDGSDSAAAGDTETTKVGPEIVPNVVFPPAIDALVLRVMGMPPPHDAPITMLQRLGLELEHVVLRSNFFLACHRSLVLRALRTLQCDVDVDSFCTAVLPPLEMALRQLFVRANSTQLRRIMSDIKRQVSGETTHDAGGGTAIEAETARTEHQLDELVQELSDLQCLGRAARAEYYSTLDGFGQRFKHQVLLDAVVQRSGRDNALVGAIGAGATWALRDLFMSSGSGGRGALRARVCHGGAHFAATATTLLRWAGLAPVPELRRHLSTVGTRECAESEATQPTRRLPRPVALLVLVMVSLCLQHHGDDQLAPPSAAAACAEFVRGYESAAHPHARIKVALRRAASAATALATLARDHICDAGAEAGVSADADVQSVHDYTAPAAWLNTRTEAVLADARPRCRQRDATLPGSAGGDCEQVMCASRACDKYLAAVVAHAVEPGPYLFASQQEQPLPAACICNIADALSAACAGLTQRLQSLQAGKSTRERRQRVALVGAMPALTIAVCDMYALTDTCVRLYGKRKLNHRGTHRDCAATTTIPEHQEMRQLHALPKLEQLACAFSSCVAFSSGGGSRGDWRRALQLWYRFQQTKAVRLLRAESPRAEVHGLTAAC